MLVVLTLSERSEVSRGYITPQAIIFFLLRTARLYLILWRRLLLRLSASASSALLLALSALANTTLSFSASSSTLNNIINRKKPQTEELSLFYECYQIVTKDIETIYCLKLTAITFEGVFSFFNFVCNT